MATYTLTNTAKEIDDAVQAVTNADTAPQANSANMVTSGGVYSAVNNLDVTNLADGVITTEAGGIANFDTDTNIPTNAAVKDYVNTNTPVLPYGRLRIKITIHDFDDYDPATSGIWNSKAYDIPNGFKVTSVKGYFSTNRDEVRVYAGDITSHTNTSLGKFEPQTNNGTLALDFTATDTNYLYLTLRKTHSGSYFQGGYFTLEKIPT